MANGVAEYLDEFRRLTGTPPLAAWLTYGEGPEINWFYKEPTVPPPAPAPQDPARPIDGSVRQVDSGTRDRTNVLRGPSVPAQLPPDTAAGAAALANFAAEIGAGLSAPSWSVSQARNPTPPNGMEALYRGETMRPAPALPPGADPWTGEGFATSRGDWRHAVAGKLLGALAPVPVNPLSAIFGMATQHAPDFTIGRERSNIRAMPGSMPGDRGGLVNVKTGATWTPKSTAQLVAEDKARKAGVSANGKTASMLGQPMNLVGKYDNKSGAGSGGKSAGSSRNPGQSGRGDQRGSSPSFGGLYADGGLVEGPGGPRDDMVSAQLSDGEFVIPADVVKGIGRGDAQRGARRLEDLMAAVRATFGDPKESRATSGR